MKANPAAYRFNCAQRAHANFLENAPQTMMSMLVAGIMYPNATTWLGLGWLVSRAAYLYGYVYGNKEYGLNRQWGEGYVFAQGGIWGLVGLTATRLLV
jgi:glutathione S-transferase